jgi:hypothetical protein
LLKRPQTDIAKNLGYVEAGVLCPEFLITPDWNTGLLAVDDCVSVAPQSTDI